MNTRDDVCYASPTTLEERRAIARDFLARFDYSLPLLVDDLTDAADAAYAAWPERLFVVGADGRIAYEGGSGPFGYDPDEVEDWLQANLAGPVRR